MNKSIKSKIVINLIISIVIMILSIIIADKISVSSIDTVLKINLKNSMTNILKTITFIKKEKRKKKKEKRKKKREKRNEYIKSIEVGKSGYVYIFAFLTYINSVRQPNHFLTPASPLVKHSFYLQSRITKRYYHDIGK